MIQFTKATKSQLKLRAAIAGPSGSGKTYSSLTIATAMAEATGKRVAVIDSEHGKSQLYADTFDFDVLDLRGDFNPRTYTQALRAAGDEKNDAGEPLFGAIVVDSLSHAWDGALEMKDSVAKRSRSGDSFGAWREVTPVFNDLIDAILTSPAHVICTLRTKTEYALTQGSNGKNKVEKLGMGPKFRDGVEYEFDIVADMDSENNWIVTKTRYANLHGRVINRPGKELALELIRWLDDGEPLADSESRSELAQRLNALPDSHRPDAKRDFKAKFGTPQDLVKSKLGDAVLLIEQWEEMATPQTMEIDDSET